MTDYTDVIDHTIDTVTTTIRHAINNQASLQSDLIDHLIQKLNTA